MRRAGATAVAIASIAVALAACSRSADTIDLTSPSKTTREGGAESVTEWLGVLRIEKIVARLNDDTAAVRAIVDGAIVASPVACFDGLPVSFEPDSYLLGVIALTKEELDQLVERIGLPTIFEGQVRTMCLD
jgi:hypothetical protein